MSVIRRIAPRDRLELAGDACLVTAAAFGLVTAIAYGLLALLTAGRSPGAAISIVASVTSTAAIAGAPLAAWLLHGRRLTWATLLGGVAGAVVAGIVFQVLVAFSMLLGLALSPLTDAELAGPIGLLIVVGSAFTVIVVAMVALGIGDLVSGQRTRLDLVRLVAGPVLLATTVGTLLVARTSDDPERGEAVIFTIAAGLSAAVLVFTADVVVGLVARRSAP